jgi:hypothetical protein
MWNKPACIAKETANSIALSKEILRDIIKNNKGMDGNIIININSIVNKKGFSTINL